MLIIRIVILILFIITLNIYIIDYRIFCIFMKKYNILLVCNKRYANALNKNNKIIHNFKNQLIVINGYAEDNKKLKSYIKEIIKEQKEIKSDKLIESINKLPLCLKGILYYKISESEEKINISLNVINNLNKINKLSKKQIKDIQSIIGILIDNAIEASIKSKKKKIIIELSIIKKTFNINITNSYRKKINVINIQKEGYSTKGKDRGYGLFIVKEIINKNENMGVLYNVKNENFYVNFYVLL